MNKINFNESRRLAIEEISRLIAEDETNGMLDDTENNIRYVWNLTITEEKL